MNHFDEDAARDDDAAGSSGSLADAIAAHLELKKEHGADPDEVAREEATALGPASRDDDSVDLHPVAEPAEPAAPSAAELASEPESEVEVESEPAAEADSDFAPEPEIVAEHVEVEAPAELPEAAEQAAASTGTFEFEFGDQDEEPEPERSPEEIQAEHDLLEDTPDFFQETPEHDRLWFDEAPPKKFDF